MKPAIQSNLPQHIGLIMDGNRRWAKQHNLPGIEGHRRVAQVVIVQLVDRCIELHIPFITFWAFSTENWQRDPKEVSGVMELFRQGFKSSAQELEKRNVKLVTVGNLGDFPQDIQSEVTKWVKKTQNNTAITVCFALSYGGRDEIVRGVKKLLHTKLKDNQLPEDFQVTVEEFGQHLDTHILPDPDLIIRPGGEKRLSGSLTWSSVYSELYFSDTLMPDFGPEKLDEALAEFQRRQRRFGV